MGDTQNLLEVEIYKKGRSILRYILLVVSVLNMVG